jgi:diguanylate cyclase (GGDEF)-like protein/PAS domain S-box-containing protein
VPSRRARVAPTASDVPLQTLFTHAPIGVLEAMADGEMIAVNPELCRMLGYSAAELIGQPAKLISDPRDQADQAAQIATVSAGSDGYAAQRRYRRKDGTSLPVLVSANAVRTPAGDVDRMICMIADVSELVSARQAVQIAHAELAEALAALRRRQQFDVAVLESVNVGVLACDADNNVVLRNAAQRRVTGMAEGEAADPALIGTRLRMTDAAGAELLPQESPLQRALAGAELIDVPLRAERDGESPRELLVTARQIFDSEGAVLGAVAAFTDITAERQVLAEIRKAASFHDAVLAASPDLIFVVDARTNRSVWSSKNLTAMLGYSEPQVRALGDETIATLVHPADRAEVTKANADAAELADGDVVSIRYRVRAAAGHYVWLSRRITPFTRDAAGRVTEVLGVARDITDVVEVERRLSDVALHDVLTGLPNRLLLTDRLHSALDRNKRNGQKLAVLFCDLDGFKQVNDADGHAAGDEVLRVTADRLRATLRAEDTAARLGGDEFVVILEPATRASSVETPVGADVYGAIVAERIRKAIAQPISYEGRSLTVTVSIGMTITRAGSDPESVLREADSAMYRAKAEGKNQYQVFGEAPGEPDVATSADTHVHAEADTRNPASAA